MTLSIQDLEMA